MDIKKARLSNSGQLACDRIFITGKDIERLIRLDRISHLFPYDIFGIHSCNLVRLVAHHGCKLVGGTLVILKGNALVADDIHDGPDQTDAPRQ